MTQDDQKFKIWACVVVALLTPAVFFLVSSNALAESLVGLIQIKGSALNSKTMLISEDRATNVPLCTSDFELRLRNLTDLVIQVQGDWRLSATGERSCFEALRYEPLRGMSGRPLLAGTLSYRSGAYVVRDAENREVILTDVPDGIRSFVGGKVIIEVKSIASPASAEAVKVIVSYRSMP